MGNAELALLLEGALTILVGVLAFVFKGAITRTEDNERRGHDLDRRLAVVEASTLHATVAEHAGRLQVLETGIAKIQADVGYVKRWVERQSVPPHRGFGTDDDTKT